MQRSVVIKQLGYEASAGWTTYGTSLADFHNFRAAQRDMNDSSEKSRIEGRGSRTEDRGAARKAFLDPRSSILFVSSMIRAEPVIEQLVLRLARPDRRADQRRHGEERAADPSQPFRLRGDDPAAEHWADDAGYALD